MQIHTLRNPSGMEVRIADYGATILSIRVPDRDGKFADVALGFDTLDEYKSHISYFGGTIGRHCNRIDSGRFSLDGQIHQLATNNGPNHLHGGNAGFDKRTWQAERAGRPDAEGVELSYLSPDGEENYPGNLAVKVAYFLNTQNEIEIHYKATTDAPTIVNLTNHTYFNLAGEGNGTVLDHIVTIDADAFTPVDELLIPTGELVPVDGTPMDFRTPHRIGERIDSPYPPLQHAGGYDHNWVLNGNGSRTVAMAADPESGRVLEIITDQPGIQFYTGNFLDGVRGRKNSVYPYRGGFCMETQGFPDSPNHGNFPSTVLRPGETYAQTTLFRFSVQ